MDSIVLIFFQNCQQLINKIHVDSKKLLRSLDIKKWVTELFIGNYLF